MRVRKFGRSELDGHGGWRLSRDSDAGAMLRRRRGCKELDLDPITYLDGRFACIPLDLSLVFVGRASTETSSG